MLSAACAAHLKGGEDLKPIMSRVASCLGAGATAATTLYTLHCTKVQQQCPLLLHFGATAVSTVTDVDTAVAPQAVWVVTRQPAASGAAREPLLWKKLCQQHCTPVCC
jgi:hypothetical protein